MCCVPYCLGAILLTGDDTWACLFRHHIRLAETVAALARKDERFEVSAPPRFGLVCFRLKVRSRQGSHGSRCSLFCLQLLDLLGSGELASCLQPGEGRDCIFLQQAPCMYLSCGEESCACAGAQQ